MAGYGVACQSPDMIVTALHVVAGRTPIKVEWHGKTVDARIEKIYKASDMALLKLSAPLGVPPMQLYSGVPPWDEQFEYWEFPIGAPNPLRKTARLEQTTSLAKINSRVKPDPGLENSLCKDGGQPYPGMTTVVINFEEPNIKKAHSGSPLTYNQKIVGLIDGGALLDGKNCVWAIYKDDFNKLLAQGSPPPAGMATCASSGATATNMYSGTRSDNPNFTPEEVEAAQAFEVAAATPLTIFDNSGDTLNIFNDQRMSFGEIYESLFDLNQQRIRDLFSDEILFSENERLSIDDLMEMTMDMHQGDKTGASFVLPMKCDFVSSKNSMGTVISVQSPSGLTTLSFYLSKNDSAEEATAEMAKFKQMLTEMGQPSEANANNIKDYNCDVSDPYYREYIDNPAYDEQTGQPTSKFFAALTINENDFLGMWVSVSDWKKMWHNKEERLQFYLLQSSVIFGDFAIF